MTRLILTLCALVFTAACGADDAPIRPTANTGVPVDASGAGTNPDASATNGTFSAGLSL